MVFFRGLVKREEKFEVHPESVVQYNNVGLSPALMDLRRDLLFSEVWRVKMCILSATPNL